eukprot:TRINITY_DN7063_c0_g1_i1.p1 TRINITY_DN7063_c0_g1~~TRINITY_DN7063_c0_g1_i1.p1  ORF type:complete len:658 (-),score=146.83 TRINITY_DN7063_c0_g1_i1:145-2118(-)
MTEFLSDPLRYMPVNGEALHTDEFKGTDACRPAASTTAALMEGTRNLQALLERQQGELIHHLSSQDEVLEQVLKLCQSSLHGKRSHEQADKFWTPSESLGIRTYRKNEPNEISEDMDLNGDIDEERHRQVSLLSDVSSINDFDAGCRTTSSSEVAIKATLFKSKSREEEDLRTRATHTEDYEGMMKKRASRLEDDNARQLSFREKLGAMVLSLKFECLFALAIVANAIFIGMEVQYSVTNPGPSPLAIRIATQCFTLLFLVELMIRWVALGHKFFHGPNWSWNVLDLFIVLTSLWESVVEVLYALQMEIDPGISGVSSLRVVRIVRITRLVRVTRIARIMRFIKALRTLVSSIIVTLKSLIWAMILLVLLVYTGAIVFTQAVSDFVQDEGSSQPEEITDALKLYWPNLYVSMLTLFMSICGGVSWEQPLAPLMVVSPACVFTFLFFISFAFFAVLNVITGVFCQSAIESATSDHDMLMQSIIADKEAHVEKVRSLFKDLDDDDSGFISLAELEENMHKKSVQTYFEALELNVSDAWNFFKLLDTDGGSAIEIEEFLFGCLRLRGEAKALELAKLQIDQQWMSKTMGKFMVYVEVSLKKLERHLKHLAKAERKLTAQQPPARQANAQLAEQQPPEDDAIPTIRESKKLRLQELPAACD